MDYIVFFGLCAIVVLLYKIYRACRAFGPEIRTHTAAVCERLDTIENRIRALDR